MVEVSHFLIDSTSRAVRHCVPLRVSKSSWFSRNLTVKTKNIGPKIPVFFRFDIPYRQGFPFEKITKIFAKQVNENVRNPCLLIFSLSETFETFENVQKFRLKLVFFVILAICVWWTTYTTYSYSPKTKAMHSVNSYGSSAKTP